MQLSSPTASLHFTSNMHRCAAMLLLLCSTMTFALCCDWLRHYAHLNNDTLSLLDHMGGPLTQQESPVNFPYRLYEEMKKAKEESQLLFIRNSIELISDLYHSGNQSSVTWNNETTHNFLITMDRQAEELSLCVSTNRKPNSKLRRYYRRLKNTVYHSGGSTVSWELIRKETQRHLELLQLLVASITASRGHNA
ncbi:hypothetical protein LDENG_00199330 [Lucifuga dentata]|nr:hypothetical protein LDENG_00199330 [Lucifuga dentata]